MTERTKYNPSLGADGFPHATLVAITQKGYDNLLKLVSIASSDGYYYKPRIDWKTIAKYQKGIARSLWLRWWLPLSPSTRVKEGHGRGAFISSTERMRADSKRYYIEVVPEPGLDISLTPTTPHT